MPIASGRTSVGIASGIRLSGRAKERCLGLLADGLTGLSARRRLAGKRCGVLMVLLRLVRQPDEVTGTDWQQAGLGGIRRAHVGDPFFPERSCAETAFSNFRERADAQVIRG